MRKVFMNRTFSSFAALFVAGALFAPGCEPTPAGALPTPKLREDDCRWYSLFLQGNRVGYNYSTTHRAVEDGRDVFCEEDVTHLSLRRGKDTIRQEIRITSTETRDGKFLHAEQTQNDGEMKITAQVRHDQLHLETTTKSSPTVKSVIPWPADAEGPAALDQSLERKPLSPGERRTLKMLQLEVGQLVDVQMAARDVESTAIGVGTTGKIQKLLQIETLTRLPNGKTLDQATYCVDPKGVIYKTVSPMAGGIEMILTTKAEALRETDAASFDFLAGSQVKLNRPLADAHRSGQIRYRVHLKDGDPAKTFAVGPSQAVKSIDANTAEITVYAIRPGRKDGNPDAPADPPTEADRRPSPWVQSDDPLIVSVAKQVAGDEKDAWRKVVAIEQFVNRDISKKNFAHVFDSASEVARSHEGDCTEHAVLLMALARAQAIPARAAAGLVYVPVDRAFSYHLWAEVFVDGRWIPVDGTLALGGIGAGHMKVTDTNLKSASAQSEAFLPVAQILDRLTIDAK
jgi:hypothetical protein